MQNDTGQQQVDKFSWSDIIVAVKTPLGLFTLVLLIIEAILGIVATRSIDQLQIYIAKGMLLGFFLVILLVALIAFFRPRSLYGLQTESKQEITADYLPYSSSLVQKAGQQVSLTKQIASSLEQLFPKGVPEGIEHREWNIISSLLRDQENLSVDLLEISKKLSEAVTVQN
ncbi:MAG: hypothetical protein D3906_04335 [Candidatus Electrothrix sp. AUS1_2]|nr:hypothetical protein [Candidatus Electrothrix sp. AUS1_2]